MDYLIHSPEEFCLTLLLQCLLPVFREDFRNLYVEAATKNKPLEPSEAAKHLEKVQSKRAPQDALSMGLTFLRGPIMPYDFQMALKTITNWNGFQIDQLFDRVCAHCGKQEMKRYIEALFYLKTQDICYSANIDPSTIHLMIPDNASFIHLIAIHLARTLWDKPGILEPVLDPERQLIKGDRFDHCVKQSIQLALAEKLPMSDILYNLPLNDSVADPRPSNSSARSNSMLSDHHEMDSFQQAPTLMPVTLPPRTSSTYDTSLNPVNTPSSSSILNPNIPSITQIPSSTTPTPVVPEVVIPNASIVDPRPPTQSITTVDHRPLPPPPFSSSANVTSQSDFESDDNNDETDNGSSDGTDEGSDTSAVGDDDGETNEELLNVEKARLPKETFSDDSNTKIHLVQ